MATATAPSLSLPKGAKTTRQVVRTIALNTGETITNVDDNELLRYSRQIMLPQIDVAGQQSLLDASVLLIGAGGLGSPIAMYLAAAGIGSLHISDHDHVDLSNLQRQIAHRQDNIGQLKVDSIKQAIHEINPDCNVICYPKKLDAQQLSDAIVQVSIVCDGSDNFASRFLINEVCKQNQTPLVSGAAIRWEGQLAVFSGKTDDPCYQCLYPTQGNEDDSCTANGVISPLVGIIGSMQALETIKYLTGLQSDDTKLTIYDALRNSWRQLNIKQDKNCPICHEEREARSRARC